LLPTSHPVEVQLNGWLVLIYESVARCQKQASRHL
jgi:hypothetical protein